MTRGSCAVAALALVSVLAAAPAHAGSLYSGPGPRPGPDLLYAKRPVSPQLTNRKPWRAKPILVSGTTAYRKGEFLYQDWLYDDNGAQLTQDPSDPRQLANLFSKQNGTYTYPDAAEYANNAADLLELRVRRVRRATAFRVSLNTMNDPALAAFSIAIGGKPGETHEFPLGANVVAPADHFLTVHPDGKRMVGEFAGADGKAVARRLPVRVDRRRRQLEVRVPDRLWKPGRRTVRLAAGVGLWDAAAGSYLPPAAERDETTPGGGAGDSSPAAFFNVAFRMDEPLPTVTENEQAVVDPAWWRDRAQGQALAEGDISPFFANVSFRKLARGRTDNRRVPRRGAMDRIYASSFELAQGVDFSHTCLLEAATCPGQYQGRLQPYAIYIPEKKRPRRGWGMTLLLHSLSANYNQYLGSRNQSQYGERGGGSIVITPEARGPDEGYENYGAADVFDVWADVARRYKLDPGWTVSTGYSMGGVGSFKLAAQFPDLFARIHPTVGFEGDVDVLASLRNVPVLMWNNHGDELVNDVLFTNTANALDEMGYRYELDGFQPCVSPSCSALFPHHLQLAVNDWYMPGAEFLGTERVERNPHRVTYVVFPERNHPELGVNGDSAYWVSRLRLREGAGQGRIDAFSHGFGRADAPVNATEQGNGVLEGGNLGDLLYTMRRKTWGEAPAHPRENRINVVARGIARAAIDTRRARVDCGVRLEVDSDGPIRITLPGCNRIVSAGTGSG